MNDNFVIGRRLKTFELKYWEEYRIWKSINDALNNFNFNILKNIHLDKIKDANKEMFISTSLKKGVNNK